MILCIQIPTRHTGHCVSCMVIEGLIIYPSTEKDYLNMHHTTRHLEISFKWKVSDFLLGLFLNFWHGNVLLISAVHVC